MYLAKNAHNTRAHRHGIQGKELKSLQEQQAEGPTSKVPPRAAAERQRRRPFARRDQRCDRKVCHDRRVVGARKVVPDITSRAQVRQGLQR